MATKPETMAAPSYDLPLADHVALVPEGISSLRDIPGLERATQGERSILKEVQYAIEMYGGRPVPEFWTGVWVTLARCLRMQTIYLVQTLKPWESHDFIWLRTLFMVDSGSAEASAPIPLSSGIYQPALTGKPSASPEPPPPTRLDVYPGAFFKIPRSLEAQVQNEGLSGFYLQEVHTLADKKSKLSSYSGDGANHFQLLPVRRELTADGDFYLGFDRQGNSESLASFAEMVDLIHQRLSPALNDFIQVLLRTGYDRSPTAAPPLPSNLAAVRHGAVLCKPADSRHHPLLSRTLVLSADARWPWQRRVVGLLSVEGASGAELDQVTRDIHRALQTDFSYLTKAAPAQAVDLFWTWHQRVYQLAREARRPIRVSGTILAARGGDWEMYNLGTAPPVLRLVADEHAPIRYELPNKNLCFLGYNPLNTISTKKLSSLDAIPSERMDPQCFAHAHRPLGSCKRDTMILFNTGWLEQCAPQQETAGYESHYGIQNLLHALRASAAPAGTEPGPQLAQRLAESAQPYAAVVHDAALLVLQT